MIHRLGLLFLLWLPITGYAVDHYMLAVTLTPAFCDNNPKWRNSLQCRDRQPFNVHGFWPQAGVGERELAYCDGDPLQLSADQQRRLRGVMSDTSQREYQWKKHGRCSGLPADVYFDKLAKQFLALKWPSQLQPRGRDALLERQAVLTALRQANPAFPERGIVLRCENKGRPPLLQEIRLCFSANGQPRVCEQARSNCPSVIKVRAR